jgi:ABC-type multidrug transport system ATPase subunit
MLTGMFAPTYGDAVAYGKSVVNDIAAVRDLIGVCPQVII